MKLSAAVIPALCVLLLSGCAHKTASISKNPGTATQGAAACKIGSADSDALVNDDDEVDPGFARFQLTPDEIACLTPQEKRALQSDTGMSFDLKKHETDEVERYFVYFTHQARPTFERWLDRARPYLPYVKKVLQEYGLPEEIAVLPFAESGYNSYAISSAGAVGMWQFMPATGRRFGLENDWWLDERRDPYKATKAAASYLSQLRSMFPDWYLALAAYNAGEGKISWALGKSGADNFFDLARDQALLKEETRLYVPKFLALVKIFRNLEDLGFKPVDWNVKVNQDQVQVKGGTDLLAMSQACGMSWSEFNALNPAFRRQVSPPDKTCTVYLPREKMQPAMAYLANPGTKSYAGAYQQYNVRKGDTWAKLAKRSDMPVEVLRGVNKGAGEIKPGDTIRIPGHASMDVAIETPVETKRTLAAKRSNYVVQKGDTLYSIAGKFDTNVSTLMASNGLESSKDLEVGDKLYIPDSGKSSTKAVKAEAEKVKEKIINYQVAEGETVWSIARKFNVDPKSLLAWNNLNISVRLKPGDKLKIMR